MSKENTQNKQIYFAAGVYKIDFKAAGYPDLIKIANEWAKDPSFKEIIVRFVSENNLGIQFVYYKAEEEGYPMEKYADELFQKFGKGNNGVYAWDVNESHYEVDDESLLKQIVVLKGIND